MEDLSSGLGDRGCYHDKDMTAHDELAFLSTSGFSVAYRNDSSRVVRCLTHNSVDVRLAAVKCYAFKPDSTMIASLIGTLAQHESWKSSGIYPASKLIAPHVTESHWEDLANAFPSMAQRNETGYQLLCQNCQSTKLADSLENRLFDSTSDESTCHLAIKSLTAVNGLNQSSLWNKCLEHRFPVVVQLSLIHI